MHSMLWQLYAFWYTPFIYIILIQTFCLNSGMPSTYILVCLSGFDFFKSLRLKYSGIYNIDIYLYLQISPIYSDKYYI